MLPQRQHFGIEYTFDEELNFGQLFTELVGICEYMNFKQIFPAAVSRDSSYISSQFYNRRGSESITLDFIDLSTNGGKGRISLYNYQPNKVVVFRTSDKEDVPLSYERITEIIQQTLEENGAEDIKKINPFKEGNTAQIIPFPKKS